MGELTTTEQTDLATQEAVIERGRGAFLEVGRALTAIRDRKLYRDTHVTFETYCEQRWEFKKSQAYRLIESAEVTANLSPIGDILPATETQARPLSKLPIDQQREVWAEVVETAPRDKAGNPQITERQVRAVVETRNPTPAKPKPQKAPADAAYEALMAAWQAAPDETRTRFLNAIRKPENGAAENILKFLNEKTGRNYRPTDANLKFIIGRLKEGYTDSECRQVIARKCREWKSDEKMAPYLRPATLFNAEKFNQYIGECVIS